MTKLMEVISSLQIHGFIEVILKCQLQQILDVKVYIPDAPQPSSLAVVTPSSSQVWTPHTSVYSHATNTSNSTPVFTRARRTVKG